MSQLQDGHGEPGLEVAAAVGFHRASACSYSPMHRQAALPFQHHRHRDVGLGQQERS